MSNYEVLEGLRSRILSDYTLLFLKTWEETRWETELAELALEIEQGLVVWSAALGPLPPCTTDDETDTHSATKFLKQIANYPSEHIFLLKDFHPYLSDPEIVRQIRDLIPELNRTKKTILFMGPETNIPLELQKEAVEVELPLPGLEELHDELQQAIHDHASQSGSALVISPDDEERLLKAVLGLSSREARKAFTRAFHGRTELDDDVYTLLVSEKRRMVQGSDLLEFYDLEEGVAEIGGLDSLKDWLRQRVRAFSEKAREQGIPTPKGMLLLGVQGCGKSLTARATAKLLSFPLIRLDVSNLLSSDRGSSEQNMRNVLRLLETVAPAVLWLDEIEKGFAGSDQESSYDATMARLMGRFLTWMDEKKAPVFVVATANSVLNLPPELLRRGRFDELFFIDLPNYHERQSIYNVHLQKRGWNPEKFDVQTLAEKTEGFSGAEIEQVVASALVESFSQGGVLTQHALDQARDQTVPLSVTMEEKIFQLREWANGRCRQATPDSRVTQMLEEEDRHEEESRVADNAEQIEEWKQLAELGQTKAAIVEYIRSTGEAVFPALQTAFADFIETTGDQGLALRADANVVLWNGLSAELASLLAKLISSKKLFLHLVDPNQYASHADQMTLPQISELPDNRLSRPCWFPVSLSDIAPEDAPTRMTRVARMKLSH